MRRDISDLDLYKEGSIVIEEPRGRLKKEYIFNNTLDNIKNINNALRKSAKVM